MRSRDRVSLWRNLTRFGTMFRLSTETDQTANQLGDLTEFLNTGAIQTYRHPS